MASYAPRSTGYPTPELTNVRNVAPMSRKDRLSQQNREDLEKMRLRNRKGSYFQYEDVSMTQPEGSLGYISEADRFVTDVAAEVKNERDAAIAKKEQMNYNKRVQRAEVEAQRWKDVEAEFEFDAQREEYSREHGLYSRSNRTSMPYNPINLQYDDNQDGQRLRYSDDTLKYRGALRAEHLQHRMNGARGFNPLTGQPVAPVVVPPRPQPPQFMRAGRRRRLRPRRRPRARARLRARVITFYVCHQHWRPVHERSQPASTSSVMQQHGPPVHSDGRYAARPPVSTKAAMSSAWSAEYGEYSRSKWPVPPTTCAVHGARASPVAILKVATDVKMSFVPWMKSFGFGERRTRWCGRRGATPDPKGVRDPDVAADARQLAERRAGDRPAGRDADEPHVALQLVAHPLRDGHDVGHLGAAREARERAEGAAAL